MTALALWLAVAVVGIAVPCESWAASARIPKQEPMRLTPAAKLQRKAQTKCSKILEVAIHELSEDKAERLRSRGIDISAGTNIVSQLTPPDINALNRLGVVYSVLREGVLAEPAVSPWGSSHRDPRGSVSGENDTDVHIPDNDDWVYSPITISGAPSGAAVTSVDVHYEIIHTYVGDLIVDLCDDDLTYCERLWWNEGGGQQNINETVYNITTFNGEFVNQEWDLWAIDTYPEDTGYIDYWWIRVWYGLPDLWVTTLSYEPANPEVGEQITVTITVENQGDAACGSFYTDFYENESTPPGGGDPGDDYALWTGLDVGGTVTFYFYPVAYSAEIWHMYAQVDYNNLITESDENNNVRGPVDVYWTGVEAVEILPYPWSGWYWPYSSSVPPNLYTTPGNLDVCEDTGPMAKYDRYKWLYDFYWEGYGRQMGLAQAWEIANHGSGETWYGHCHAWSPASFLYPEPSVYQDYPERGVCFSILDQKGLVTETYHNTVHHFDALYGTEYPEPGGQLIPPGMFWLALYEQLNLWNRPVIADLHLPEIWYHPIYRDSIRYTPNPGGTYDGHIKIWFANDSGWEVVQPGFTGTIEETLRFYFAGVIMQDGLPQPLSGAWTGNSAGDPNLYPDVAWHASERHYGNPYVWESSVDSIVQGFSPGAVASEDLEALDWLTLEVYPNPFNPVGTVTFCVAAQGREASTLVPVDLGVFDVQGRCVATLAKGLRNSGPHTVTWDGMSIQGTAVRSGVYFVRLAVGDERRVKKVVVLK